MTTILTLLAAGYAIFVGASVCQAIAGFDKAAEEIRRDREWWRGLERPPADELTPLADAAE